MIDAGLSRTTINARLGKIRRMFKWAIGEELIPAVIYEGWRAVDGLRARAYAPDFSGIWASTFKR
jgi:hypothetical protein